MKSVLVVDDEIDIGDAVQMLLEDEGYQVLRAANGREGLAQIEQHRPEVVLLDLMMPLMSGWDVIATLAREGRLHDQRIIVISAADGHRLAQQHRIEHLDKPFDLERLLARIAKPPDS